MRTLLAISLAACLLGTSAIGLTARQTRPASPAPPMTSIDEVLQAVRADLQSERADIMAKNMTLTSEQAAKFWPVFNTYQQQQNAIMDDQLKTVQRFIESFETMDDAAALALINAHFDRDARMTALRQKWLGEFQSVLGTKLAVRVMQIDRRLSLAHQMQIAARIPLAH